MTAKLCVTVTGRTMAELRQRRDEAADADLVELRVDTVDDPSAAAALAGRRNPVIFTCRASWEGGSFKGSEEERHRLLREAQQLGAEYVDVEWRSGFDDLIAAKDGRGIVLSMHDFDGMPGDLAARAEAMRRSRAEIVKLAVRVERLSQLLPLLALGRSHAGASVVVAMGEAGVASRVLASRFGSAWTYAGDQVAPGQLPATQMVAQLGFRRASKGSMLFGVVGRPVMHSLSPAMHNRALGMIGIDAVYLPLAAADFDDFLTFADAFGLAGASVTAPFKLAAFHHASSRDRISSAVGAANTLRRVPGGWEARNTDVPGFLAPLAAVTNVAGKRATVLGAGGAARAVAVGLQSAGARVAIAARDRHRAAEIASVLNASTADWPPSDGSWDVLVNTTPVGTAPDIDSSPLPDGPWDGELVYDLVYNPPETRLLRDARAAGCRTIGGLAMLVAQAEQQFEWWTGVAAPPGVMRDAALEALNRAMGTRGTVGMSR